MEAVIAGADIDFHDIALMQDPLGTRYAVDHLIVDADAGTSRKASITEEGGLCAALLNIMPNDSIQFSSTDTLFYMIARHKDRLSRNPSRLAHHRQLFAVFNLNHGISP